MPETVEGALSAADRSFALVASRFNDTIVERLVDGALGTLRRLGADLDRVTVAWVPGAFELPLAAKRLAATGTYDAIIVLGCVIRGATPHFDYVAGQAAAGIQRVALDTDVPVIFGVLTTETIEQAIERSGTKAGNKGADAAAAAVEMASLLERL